MGKWKDFFFYKRTIDKNIKLLEQKHGLKKDWVYRLYKVYTLNEEDLKKYDNYGGEYIDLIIKNEMKSIDKTIVDLKLFELVGLYDVRPFPEVNSLGITVGFKPFNTAKRASRIIWTILFCVIPTVGFLISSVVGAIVGVASWLSLLSAVNYFGIFKL